jgi:beta-glucanase (GH16 family)
MNFARMTLLTASVALAGALIASPAVAQKAPNAPKTKTAKKTEPPKKASKSTARRSTAKKATKKKAPSACAGLTQSRCRANKACGWIKPKKAVSKNGRKLTPYCRKVAGIAKKKKKKAK